MCIRMPADLSLQQRLLPSVEAFLAIRKCASFLERRGRFFLSPLCAHQPVAPEKHWETMRNWRTWPRVLVQQIKASCEAQRVLESRYGSLRTFLGVDQV